MYLFKQIGEWNPQILREFKGRLKTRNIVLGIVTSLGIQLLLLLYFAAELPSPNQSYGRYCLQDSKGFCTGVKWLDWWQDFHHVFDWILALGLVVGGVYLLVSNLAEENRRGTLNFIRLSPQSAYTILLGKMLGVPIILYLGAAIAIPLHTWSAIAAGADLTWLLSFDFLLVSLCGFFYSLGMLYTFMGGSQGLLAAGASAFCLWMTLYTDFSFSFNYYIDFDDLQWYWAPIGDNIFAFRGFVLLNCFLWSYWIWRGLNRRFKNPTATILSKKESYGLVACFQLILLGCVLPQITLNQSSYRFHESIFAIGLMNLLWFLCLIAILSPHRQTLQDWARYSHNNRQSRWQDWLFGEKSPAPVAIAINLGITAAIFLPWILLWPTDSQDKLQAIAGILICCSLMFIYAVLAQIMLLIKIQKRSLWAAGSVNAAIILPPLILGLFEVRPEYVPELFLFTMLPFLGIEYISAMGFLAVVVSHCTICAGLTWKLKQQLHQAGESQTKALLAGR